MFKIINLWLHLWGKESFPSLFLYWIFYLFSYLYLFIFIFYVFSAFCSQVVEAISWQEKMFLLQRCFYFTQQWLWADTGLPLLKLCEEGYGNVVKWDGKGLYDHLAWIFPCCRQLLLTVNFLSCHLHRFMQNSVHFVLYVLYVTFSVASFYSFLWDASRAYFLQQNICHLRCCVFVNTDVIVVFFGWILKTIELSTYSRDMEKTDFPIYYF